ncbi:hypothetical protein VC83_02368 [Pseudogymnoascus destructans]|uniref:SWI-SNF chromatin-remodeling complex protein n=1 Tax=Pseudogymnoascus destructans TaxID=655981 RepID=A0A177AI26_9PEZI|nr:uncharacterized protein VC83_02368 [Pseudogymnoascus destructans]OAF60903.1 hypothetical protein VC83_02368 [Pseudogymnoascus destructans]
MSKPYPDTFDSPLASRAAAAPAPVSYQANVNRQKTKKWVDAKPGNYGGDDWGDDYDDGYNDAPPPPPVPKVTGLRQPVQGVRHDVGIKKTYGDLPHLPKDAQDRSSTNPPLLRQSSFSRDDERRAFSSGPSQQDALPSNLATAAAATPSPPLRLASQRKQLPPPGTESSARSSYSESSRSSAHTASDARSASGDAHNNYPAHDVTSPLRSAALSPQARAASHLSRSDSPPVNVASPPAQFSPRNTTLNQTIVPDSSANSAAPAPASATSVAKALPFIRPADIYKRLEEERQRKASGDSSMDSAAATIPDTQSSPALPSHATAPVVAAPVVATPVALAPAEPANYNRGGYDTYEEEVPDYGRQAETYQADTYQEEVPDYGRRQAPMLESVQERRSEYGFDDMAAKSPEAAQKLQQVVQKQEAPVQQFLPQVQEHVQQAQPEAASDADANRRYSISPKLPDLHRMSGFGFDMWSQSAPDGNVANSPVAERQMPKAAEQTLQRQESQGFTSVVHQAFDRTDSIPETPTSQGTSNVRRTDSDSTGTAGISPIMSRVSSGANPDSRGRTQEPKDNLTPAIAGEKEPDSRRASAIVAEEPNQTPFHMGHRRDLSAPSNGNSPARSPHLETATLAPQSGEVAQVAEVTRQILPTAGAWDSYSITAESAAGEVAQKEAIGEDPTPVEPSQSPEATTSPQPLATFSAAPSPPLKDDVTLPPLTTSKAEDLNGAAPKDDSETQNPLMKLPTLSPTDDETDRLHKEIVRSLSPRGSTSIAAQDWVPPPNAAARQSTLGLPALSATRESMYLPSEYDNYWAETEEDTQVEPQTQEQTAPVADAATSTASTGLHKVEESKDIPAIAPLSPKCASMLPAEPIQPTLERKFSWEALPEQVTTAADDSQSPPAIVSPQPIVAERELEQGSVPGATIARSDSASPAPLSLRSPHASAAQPEDHKGSVGSEGIVTEAVAATAVVAPAVSTIRPVSADSEDPGSSSQAAPPYSKAMSTEGTDTVSPMSAKVDPVRSQSQQINSMLDIGAPQTSPSPHDGPPQSFQQNDVPRPQTPVDPTMPKPFKEIMSLSSPQQRINAYNESRQQFATMDSGLANWMHATTAQPHLQNPLASPGAGAGAQSSQRPKSGNILTPKPQPYYQQYLNASTPTASPPPQARYSGGTPTTGTQGFGSTSSKTTQQVQAKSKELLHTAGIFGGRASKAGKGLLAKGKSRFKGSGDKDAAKASSPTIDTKPGKSSRRASWAFSLSSSPSTARPATFSGTDPAPFGRTSESSGSQTAAGAGRRRSTSSEQAPTMKAQAQKFLEVNPPTSSTLRDARWGSETALSTDDGSARNREGSVADPAAGGKDDIAPPVPIGKYQPSWDPYNATPIVEEEGFGWESPVKGSAVPVPARGWGGVDETPETPVEREVPGEGEIPSEGEGWVMVEESVRRIMGVAANGARPVHERGDSEVSALTVVPANEGLVPLESLDEQSEVPVVERDVQPEPVVEPVAEPVAEPVDEQVIESVEEPAVEEQAVEEPIVEEPVVEEPVEEELVVEEPVVEEPVEEPTPEEALVAEPIMAEPIITSVLPDIATNGHTQPDSEVRAINNPEVSPEQTYLSPIDSSNTDNKRQAGLWSPGAIVETPTSLTPETPSGLTPSAGQPSYAAAFSALPPIRRSSTFGNNSVTRLAQTLSNDAVEQDDVRSSGAVSPVSITEEPREMIPEHPVEAINTAPPAAPTTRDRGPDETVHKETQRYSFQDDFYEPQPEILSRPSTMTTPRNGDVLHVAPTPLRSVSPGSRPLVPLFITNQLPTEPQVRPGFVGHMLEAPGAQQFPPVQQQMEQEELSPVQQQQQQQQQQQYVPVQQGLYPPGAQGQFSPVQQRQFSPVPQGQMVPGQQGQYLPMHQGQYPPMQQGQYPPGQQGQFAPAPQGQHGQYPQQGQYPHPQQGQMHLGQQGQYPPQQGQYPPMQQGQFAPGQQGHPQGHMLVAPIGKMLPVQQGQLSQMPPQMLSQQQGAPRLPLERMPPMQQGQIPQAPQQGPRQSMPPSAHQRRSSSDAQPRMRPASNSSQGVPMSAGGFLQQSTTPQFPPGQQQRTSIEAMRNRLPSMSGVSQPPKITPQYTENRQSMLRGSAAKIPPSSSERYPELFQPQQDKALPNDADRDVPPDYPSVGRGQLPRQQVTEYEIAGVGPPMDDARNGSVRHSRKPSILKEIGGRLSRGSSLERNLPALEDDGTREMRTQLDSRRDSVASSDDMSLNDPEKPPERRRSRIIAALSPSTRGPTPDIPPQSRESMVTHRPSQATLLANTPAPGSPLPPPEKRRTFFGRGDTGGLEKKEDKQKMFSGQSTQVTMDSTQPGKEKKNRFLAISSMFTGKKGDADRGRGSSRHGTYVPSILPGIMILVKNENERQILEQQGLVERAPPQVQDQPPGGPQPQPQQHVLVNPAALQRINTGEAQGQNVQGHPVQQQMTPVAQQPPPQHQQFQTIAPLRIRQDSNLTIGTIGEPLEKQHTQPTGTPQQQMVPPVVAHGQARGTPPQVNPNAQQPPQGHNKPMPPPSFGSARISEEPIDLHQRNLNGALHQQIQPMGTPGGQPTLPRMPNSQQQAPVASTTSRESTPRPTADADRRASVILGPDPEDRLRRRTTQPIETLPGQHPEDKSLIVNRPVVAQAQGQERSMVQQKVTPPSQIAYLPEDIHQLPFQRQPPPIQRQPTFNTVPGQQHQGVYQTPPIQHLQNSQAQQQQMYMNQQQQQQMYTPPPMHSQGFQQVHRVQSPAMSQQTSSPPPTASAVAPAPAKAKKGLFSSLLGGRRSSAMADNSSNNNQQAPPAQQTPPPQNYNIAPMGQQPLQQQYYATPPIPGAYALVRGEGTLAPPGTTPGASTSPNPAPRARASPSHDRRVPWPSQRARHELLLQMGRSRRRRPSRAPSQKGRGVEPPRLRPIPQPRENSSPPSKQRGSTRALPGKRTVRTAGPVSVALAG